MEKFNLTRYIIEKNQNNLQKTALIFIDEDFIKKYTYKEIFEKIQIVAQFLISKGHHKKEKILLRLPSNPYNIFCFFGCILAGVVPIPVSRMLTEKEIEFILHDSNCNAIIYQKNFLNYYPKHIQLYEIQEIFSNFSTLNNLSEPETNAEDPAFLIYTSGTTSIPKGVIHAQRNILGRIPIQKEWLDIHPEDILLHSGELNWTYTLGVGVMDVFANQATSILVGNIRKDPSIWTKIIQTYGATIFATVPSLYRRIIKYSESEVKHLTSLRHSLTAGEALHPELYRTWTNLTEKPMYEALGMSEISTYISSGPTVPTKIGSPGKPQKNRLVRIISTMDSSTEDVKPYETGLIAVHKSDPGLMLGYHNRPEEEKEIFREDWFIGGDLAYKDSEGYYWFMGRNNEIIKSFGYRVSPLEIENLLHHHPFVLEAAVCEIQKDQWMSFIVAFVIKKEGTTLTEKEILDYCKINLAEYKCPKKVIFLKEFPRNLAGKILKKDLKKEFDFKI